jgi:hypothetical protein
MPFDEDLASRIRILLKAELEILEKKMFGGICFMHRGHIVNKLGFEEVCRKYVTFYPERLNANAFLGIICSIENTVWTQSTPQQRQEARKMAQLLRIEFGLPNRPRRSKRP